MRSLHFLDAVLTESFDDDANSLGGRIFALFKQAVMNDDVPVTHTFRHELDTVMGRESVWVRLRIRIKHSNQSRIVIMGGIADPTKTAVQALFVNVVVPRDLLDASKNRLMRAVMGSKERVTAVVRHEIEHLNDPKIFSGTAIPTDIDVNSDIESQGSAFIDYYTSPHEIRAYAMGIVKSAQLHDVDVSSEIAKWTIKVIVKIYNVSKHEFSHKHEKHEKLRSIAQQCLGSAYSMIDYIREKIPNVNVDENRVSSRVMAWVDSK